MAEVSLPEVLASMTEHLGRLRAVLQRQDPTTLTTRPPSGDWSAIENVRHLIFTTQHHLGPFVPGGLGLSKFGLPQGRHADANATTDPAAVFTEWARVHAALCDRLAVADPALAVDVPGRGIRVLADQLSRCLRHQQAHGRLALRAVSQVTGQTVRLPRAQRDGSRPLS
jgi:hypothetical protein